MSKQPTITPAQELALVTLHRQGNTGSTRISVERSLHAAGLMAGRLVTKAGYAALAAYHSQAAASMRRMGLYTAEQIAASEQAAADWAKLA